MSEKESVWAEKESEFKEIFDTLNVKYTNIEKEEDFDEIWNIIEGLKSPYFDLCDGSKENKYSTFKGNMSGKDKLFFRLLLSQIKIKTLEFNDNLKNNAIWLSNKITLLKR